MTLSFCLFYRFRRGLAAFLYNRIVQHADNSKAVVQVAGRMKYPTWARRAGWWWRFNRQTRIERFKHQHVSSITSRQCQDENTYSKQAITQKIHWKSRYGRKSAGRLTKTHIICDDNSNRSRRCIHCVLFCSLTSRNQAKGQICFCQIWMVIFLLTSWDEGISTKWMETEAKKVESDIICWYSAIAVHFVITISSIP